MQLVIIVCTIILILQLLSIVPKMRFIDYILQTLPDQQHCYFFTENKNMEGILVQSIPFTHPCHVSQILVILRQQALFNTIINSCVRQNAKQGKFRILRVNNNNRLLLMHITFNFILMPLYSIQFLILFFYKKC